MFYDTCICLECGEQFTAVAREGAQKAKKCPACGGAEVQKMDLNAIYRSIIKGGYSGGG